MDKSDELPAITIGPVVSENTHSEDSLKYIVDRCVTENSRWIALHMKVAVMKGYLFLDYMSITRL